MNGKLSTTDIGVDEVAFYYQYWIGVDDLKLSFFSDLCFDEVASV